MLRRLCAIAVALATVVPAAAASGAADLDAAAAEPGRAGADPAAARRDGDGRPPLRLSQHVLAGARRARSHGLWSPGRFDTCPARLHDRYATGGPRGKTYPTWHPPAVRRPVTGERCTFGHEHGRDPRGSRLYRWIARRLGGLPFGVANEALDAHARARPAVRGSGARRDGGHGGSATRHEDHVGHKVEWQNGVRMRTSGGSGGRAGATSCDFLTKVHQGSHSADAFANNVHELVFALRCRDGTRLLATTLVRFGRPNAFHRGCRRDTAVPTGADLPFPAGPGRRLIPDRACADRHVLVAPDERSRFARGLYESWAASNRLVTRRGRTIARWSPTFGVFNPSRYHDPAAAGGVGRTVDLCWERTPAGERAAGSACDIATAYGSRGRLAFDDPRSPFDGSHRDVSLRRSAVANRRGPSRWYTDPYGRGASRRPFPGAIRQLVGPTAARLRPRLPSLSFGSERPYTAAGVHAPN